MNRKRTQRAIICEISERITDAALDQGSLMHDTTSDPLEAALEGVYRIEETLDNGVAGLYHEIDETLGSAS